MIDNGGRRVAQRRVFNYHYHIPERRSGHDRRSGFDRRRLDRGMKLDVNETFNNIYLRTCELVKSHQKMTNDGKK